MSEKFDSLTDKHIDFIGKQHIYFVGTAEAEGFINVSPKGMDSFRVLGPNKAMWLNLTGSGNETAAHLLTSSRMTIMFCSFDQQPLILRLYGQARTFHKRDEGWSDRYAMFPGSVGARQIFELDIRLVQTSCGFAVPEYELKNERNTLAKWADKQGEEGISVYWDKKNSTSLNGKDTDIA